MKITKPLLFLTLSIPLVLSGKNSMATNKADVAEESMDCTTPPDPSIQLTSTQAFMHSAAQVAVAKASVAKSALDDVSRQKLEAAVSSDQLQKLVLEQFSHLKQGSHAYSFSRPDGCALTKSYGNYHESICLQPKAAQLGMQTSRLPSTISSEELRKTATAWSLNLTCKGKNCAVYVDQSQFNLKDAYLLIAHFDDEQAAILAVEGLNALAKTCTSSK
jgi:hypothetical protein